MFIIRSIKSDLLFKVLNIFSAGETVHRRGEEHPMKAELINFFQAAAEKYDSTRLLVSNVSQ